MTLDPDLIRGSINHVERIVSAILVGAGASAADAEAVAREIVDAEARGYESQGLIRVPSYVDAALAGSTRSPTSLETIRESPSAIAWDAHNGWGPVAALAAMEQCVERADQTGACIGVIRNIGHIGRLGYYVDAAADRGVVGFIACSSSPEMAMMAPWGATEARLATNPFAYGFPRAGGANVVVDVSSTQTARGKVLHAAATGQDIPETWALDGEGQPTTDPMTALPPRGTLAPLGGHKGYALAVAVELLCGGLAGEYPPASSSVFVAAYSPRHVTTFAEYAAALEALDAGIASSLPVPGSDGARLPGTGSETRRCDAEVAGIAVSHEIWRGVVEAAARVRVRLPG